MATLFADGRERQIVLLLRNNLVIGSILYHGDTITLEMIHPCEVSVDDRQQQVKVHLVPGKRNDEPGMAILAE